MAIDKKQLLPQYLDKISVFLEDTDPYSRYFKISELPDTFSGGKNGFKIQGSEELLAESELYIEIVDAKGDTIYYECLKGSPQYYEGTNVVVSVIIYPDTAFGPCTITILGELTKYEVDGVIYDIPDEWLGLLNVKWQAKINVQPYHPNTTKIRLIKQPQITIEEALLPIYQREIVSNNIRTFVNGKTINYADGTLWNNQSVIYKLKFVNPLTDPEIQSIYGGGDQGKLWPYYIYTGNIFPPTAFPNTPVPDSITANVLNDMVNNPSKINITYPWVYNQTTFAIEPEEGTRVHDNKKWGDKIRDMSPVQISSYQYTNGVWELNTNAYIQRYIIENIRYGLKNKLVRTVYTPTLEAYPFADVEQIEGQPVNKVRTPSTPLIKNFWGGMLDYTYDIVSLIDTGINQSYAKIKISNLDTATGDIYRVKVLAKSKTALGGYELLEDIRIETNELLLAESFNNGINVRTGVFNDQLIIDNFWKITGLEGNSGLQSMEFNTRPDSVQVRPSTTPTNIPITGSVKFSTNSPIVIDDINTQYELSFYTTHTGSFTPGAMDVYMSGSAFLNSDSKKLGKKIIEYNLNGFRKFDKQSLTFNADRTGSAFVTFIIKKGPWQFSDISLKNATETSFTPTEFTVKTLPHLEKSNETFDFKFELYDINYSYAPITLTSTKTFVGGNNFIKFFTENISGSILGSYDNTKDALTTLTRKTGSFEFTNVYPFGNPDANIEINWNKNLFPSDTNLILDIYDEEDNIVTEYDIYNSYYNFDFIGIPNYVYNNNGTINGAPGWSNYTNSTGSVNGGRLPTFVYKNFKTKILPLSQFFKNGHVMGITSDRPYFWVGGYGDEKNNDILSQYPTILKNGKRIKKINVFLNCEYIDRYYQINLNYDNVTPVATSLTAPYEIMFSTTTDVYPIYNVGLANGGGYSHITDKGLVWMDDSIFTNDDDLVITLPTSSSNGPHMDEAFGHMNNLIPGHSYKVRSYGTNAYGTVYSDTSTVNVPEERDYRIAILNNRFSITDDSIQSVSLTYTGSTSTAFITGWVAAGSETALTGTNNITSIKYRVNGSTGSWSTMPIYTANDTPRSYPILAYDIESATGNYPVYGKLKGPQDYEIRVNFTCAHYPNETAGHYGDSRTLEVTFWDYAMGVGYPGSNSYGKLQYPHHQFGPYWGSGSVATNPNKSITWDAKLSKDLASNYYSDNYYSINYVMPDAYIFRGRYTSSILVGLSEDNTTFGNQFYGSFDPNVVDDCLLAITDYKLYQLAV